MDQHHRIGIIGTGFIARGLVTALARQPGLTVAKVLTRRDPARCAEFSRPDLLTRSVTELIDHADLCVECSGDALYGTDVLAAVMAARIPIVTMDSELQVTTG